MGADAARQRLVVALFRIRRAVEQVQLIRSAVEVVVILLVLVVREVEHAVAVALQRGKIVVDALHIVVQIGEHLVHGVHALAQIAQQIGDAVDHLSVGGIGLEIHSLQQALEIADFFGSVLHLQNLPMENRAERGSPGLLV